MAGEERTGGFGQLARIERSSRSAGDCTAPCEALRVRQPSGIGDALGVTRQSVHTKYNKEPS